jgi:hypothetical protein
MSSPRARFDDLRAGTVAIVCHPRVDCSSLEAVLICRLPPTGGLLVTGGAFRGETLSGELADELIRRVLPL